jgi:hypothetical protein
MQRVSPTNKRRAKEITGEEVILNEKETKRIGDKEVVALKKKERAKDITGKEITKKIIEREIALKDVTLKEREENKRNHSQRGDP